MTNKFHQLARSASEKGRKSLSHEHALKRIAAKGIEIATFIDVGAARGAWSLLAEKFWPDARYHLLEAKDVWSAALETLASKRDNFSFTMKAASDTPGTIYFPKDGEPYAGAAFKEKTSRDDLEETPATSVDHETSSLQLSGPFALKLDTHGTEVDILEGARETLKDTALICIETYNFIGQKRFPEMLIHLQSLGFRPVDISEPLYRESDAALWQLDFYLMRADHPLFGNYGFN